MKLRWHYAVVNDASLPLVRSEVAHERRAATCTLTAGMAGAASPPLPCGHTSFRSLACKSSSNAYCLRRQVLRCHGAVCRPSTYDLEHIATVVEVELPHGAPLRILNTHFHHMTAKRDANMILRHDVHFVDARHCGVAVWRSMELCADHLQGTILALTRDRSCNHLRCSHGFSPDAGSTVNHQVLNDYFAVTPTSNHSQPPRQPPTTANHPMKGNVSMYLHLVKMTRKVSTPTRRSPKRPPKLP